MIEGGSHVIRVMMADDNAEIRDRLHRYLKTKPDIDIVGSACNGAEAECMLRRLNPDVLLLDLVMPEIDGLELMRRMQAQPGASAVQVIVLTSLMRDGIIRQAMLLGASYYMVKPFELPELLARLRTYDLAPA